MKTMTRKESRQQSAEGAFSQVQETAEKIRNDETATVGTVSAGDVIRQGDLYVVALKGLPSTARPIKDRQLAPGTSQGSRHVLKGDCQVYEADRRQIMTLIGGAMVPAKVELHEPLIGPVFETKGEVELDHPEHGNRILPAGEVFAVVYQRAFAEEVRRQVD